MSTKWGAVILAAGGSRRMGRPKQLLPFQGKTMIETVAETALASGCGPVIAMLGNAAEAVSAILRSQAAIVVVRNERWVEGMAGTIRMGIATLRKMAPDCAGALLLLGDQPLVEVAHLERLLAWGEAGNIGASQYEDGSPGVPACFPASYFAELEALRGDEGAKSLLARCSEKVKTAPLGRMAQDVDTLPDVEKLR